MLVSKGVINMNDRQDEWIFFRLRAAQLFDEGEVKAAIRLLRMINREQIKKLEEPMPNMNEWKTVSTLG